MLYLEESCYMFYCSGKPTRHAPRLSYTQRNPATIRQTIHLLVNEPSTTRQRRQPDCNQIRLVLTSIHPSSSSDCNNHNNVT